MNHPRPFCPFKERPNETWTFKGTSRRLIGPYDGDPPVNQPIRRCPVCNRRLRLRAVFCYGGEFLYWEIPAHKPRMQRKPGPRRTSRIFGRGK